jgi:hypothetical protein
VVRTLAAYRGYDVLTAHRRLKQTKKHKTWDGDAVLIVTGTDARLIDTDGRLCARPRFCPHVRH